MKQLILGLAVSVLLLGGIGSARGGYVNGSTSVLLALIGSEYETGVPTLSTPISSSVSTQDGTGGGPESGYANVLFYSSPDQFLTWKVQSGFSMTLVGPNGAGAAADTYATWSDVLFLSNTNPDVVGHTLRLNFYANFTYQYNGAFDNGTNAGSTVTVSGSNVANSSNYPTTQVSNGIDVNPSTGFTYSTYGFDTLTQLPNGLYHGTFHLDIPIVPGGGYIPGVPGSFGYGMTDESGGQVFLLQGAGAGSVSFEDPDGFSSITLPDVGNVTPESLGVSVTFASGIVSPNLRPSVATPEPSTLTLLGIGALGMFGYGWRRRKQADA